SLRGIAPMARTAASLPPPGWACKQPQAAASTAPKTYQLLRVLLNILIHPIGVTLCDIENKFRLPRTVRRPRIDHHLRSNALPLERVIQLVTLRRGHAYVGLSMQYESRSFDVFYERHG